MRKKWLVSFIGILLALLFLAACSDQKNEDDQRPENQTGEEVPPQNAEEEKVASDEKENEVEGKNIYPLTGLRTNEPVDDRIVAVMVNNHAKARPQTGLSKADIVFEILAEGNITRFMALFQSEQPTEVGPVRSAREYYYQLAKGYSALYVYHGAATHIEEELRSGVVDNLNGSYYDNDNYLFKRSSTRVAPHNSYLLFDNIYEEAGNQGYQVEMDHQPLPFLQEEETAKIEGRETAEVSFHYDTTPTRYVYNEEEEKYSRYNAEDQSVELDSNVPIQLDNVFLIETAHKVIDDAGRREVDLKSGGNAYLLQKGKLQVVEWRNVDGRILPYKDGSQVGFVPGKTWINVLPESKGLESSVTIK
ncbi:DUF3048 domain-containing protein [Sediminibacillus massiliensis]|uniref:DUF3048 domain-containing protein n=1 Tax=Sediminibacillus massiliensis TaxID=1926277 RepID=UPI0009886169|nr:DUF3048 domain-containing protein [Sediminibacillus massiliensis]